MPPFFRTWYGKIVLVLVIAAVLWFLDSILSDRHRFNPYYFRILMLVGVSMILSLSLNLVNGVTGQFSIGHAGFMALGGYTAAAVTVYGQGRFLPNLSSAPVWQQHGALVLAMIVGGIVAAIAGYVVGLPSLRLRGDYLAIVTLGFGEIIRVTILNIPAVGGAAGFSGHASAAGRVTIPSLTTFFWVYAVVVGLIFFSRNMLRSTQGLTYFAVREDEIAAEAMGVPTTQRKVTAFVLSAFFAGVAGALYAHYEMYLQPEAFGFLRSIEIVTMVVLGGMGSISGAALGGAILGAAPELLRIALDPLKGRIPQSLSADLVRQLLYALLLIILMLTRPQGIFGSREISLRGLFSKRRRNIGSPLTGA
jgi:branched-chain amino acid transport system permease protein